MFARVVNEPLYFLFLEATVYRCSIKNAILGIIHLVRTPEFSEKLSFLTPARTCNCAHQGLRNVRFSENFAYVPNE